jgi:hypothetical protein
MATKQQIIDIIKGILGLIILIFLWNVFTSHDNSNKPLPANATPEERAAKEKSDAEKEKFQAEVAERKKHLVAKGSKAILNTRSPGCASKEAMQKFLTIVREGDSEAATQVLLFSDCQWHDKGEIGFISDYDDSFFSTTPAVDCLRFKGRPDCLWFQQSMIDGYE